MKRLLSLTASLILCSSILAQDFRNANWGMTMEQVEESEGLRPIFKGYDRASNANVLQYEIHIEHRKVTLYYTFEAGRLAGAQYIILWGSWQNSREDHTLEHRMYSMANIFRTIENKGFLPRGKWIFSQEILSKDYEDFTNCQQYNGPFKYSNENIDKLSKCLDSALRNSKIEFNKLIEIIYYTDRTRLSVKFPTRTYYPEVYQSTIGWMNFSSNLSTSPF